MKNLLPLRYKIIVAAILGMLNANLQAQTTFPGTGFTLPNGKTIVITYEVDVNANACPTGSIPGANLSNQSNVSGTNFATKQTDDPDIAGTSNPTLTPFSALTLGDRVYKDINRNGVYDSGTDQGVGNVLLNVYLDNGDGVLTAADGAPIGVTSTLTGGPATGSYTFTPICPGNYIVEVAPANFLPGGPLYDTGLSVALISSPVGGAPDPDNDVDNDDNGDPVAGFGVASQAITLAYGAEPTNDGDTDNNTNLTLDFGFKTPTTVSIGDVSLAEGTGGSTTAFNFIVTRNDNSEAFSLTVNTNNGTATVADNDYTAISNGTVSFTAGGSLTAMVTVLVNQDNKVEANETFTVDLSGAPSGVSFTDASGLGTITNDDAAVVTLTGGASLNEGASFTFTATLNNPVQGGFMVAYATNDGTATTADNDYTDNDGTLSFTGTAGETKTITVVTTVDNKVELDETFTVALGAITGAPAGVTTAGSPQTGTMLNDDAATISIAANVSGLESSSPQTFSVTLSNPVDVAVTVQFNTTNGTATTADNDYTGIVNQTVTFPVNTITAQSVNVVLISDSKVEANETYTGTISALSASSRNVILGTTTRTGTILNDDATTLSIAGPVTHDEGNSGTTNYVFSVSLTAPVQDGFTVNYTTNDGTATTANLDYVDNDGPALNFTGVLNETKTVTVQVIGDLNIEPNETFTFLLGSITASSPEQTAAISIVGNNPETGTIVNDEQDWGDAPTAAQSGFAGTYPTLSSNNGARHAEAPGGLHLGATVDADLDGQPNATATGDGADEDGVTLPVALIINTTANITVNASGSGFLNAWADFNRDGDWTDPGEQIFTNTAVVAGNNALSFAVPGGASIGGSFLRFRVSTASGTAVDGLAADGEVEDYAISILDNQFSINNPSVLEGNAGTSNLVFTVNRSSNATSSSVDYAITGGSATSGSDYAPLAAGTLNFTAGGALTQTVTVTVNGDLLVEDDETVVLTISNPINGGISGNTGTGTITNDDTATLTLSGGVAQNEGNSGMVSYTFTTTLSTAVQGGFQVPYTTNDGTATTADNDYIDNDGTLMFTGNAGETKTITVMVNGDNKVELNETFTVALGAITNTTAVQAAAITKVGSPQTGTINNDDAATINVAANVSGLESSSPQTFSVTLSNPVDVAVTVQFNTTNGTATTADNDYTGIVNQTVTFPVNTITAQSVNVVIINDPKVEANETYTGTISGLSANSRDVILGTTTRTGTILNDDATTLSIAGPVTHDEGNSGTTNYVFSISLTAPVQDGFTLNYTTNDGTATTANLDYVDNDGPALNYTGVLNETKTVTVQVVGDLNIEPNETFTFLLGSITASSPEQTAAISIVGSNPQTGTIVNDEQDWGDAPTAAQSGFAGTYPTLSANNGARHAEAPGGLRLGATLDADLDGQPNATATGDGADEDGVTLPGALIINTTANITVNASGSGFLNAWADFNRDGDWTDPGEQVFTNTAVVAGNNALSFAVPGGASIGGSFLRFRVSTASGTAVDGLAADGEVEDYAISILDNQFSINNPSVTEGNVSTSNLVFTVSRTTNATASSVDYAITGGSATSGSDYAPLAAGTLNFTAGGALTQTVTVTVNGDLVVEDNETVVLTLSNPVNGGISSNTGIGTITNDDAATLTLSGGVAQNEGNAGMVAYTFSAMLSAAVQGGFQVAYTTNDGTATTADNDYVDNDGTLTFMGSAGEVKFITVQVNGDNKVELNETFTVALGAITATSSVQAAAITKVGTPQTGTINNDDAATVAIAGNVSQLEATSPQTFSVTLTNPVDVAITVQFSTTNGTASTADNDYIGIGSQTVTFAAGSTTTQTVPVTIINDSKVETDEVFNVAIGALSNFGRNVSLGTSTGTGTILNDDNATVTLSGGISVNEGNSGNTPVTFTATLSAAVQGGLTANYLTNDGTATTADADYTDNDGALVFTGTASETKTFTVNVLGDHKVEANETFQTVITSLGLPVGLNPASVTITGSPQTVTIFNDEIDFGDAPDTYATLLASNGARHATVLGFRLGAAIDGEDDGQPNGTATGDGADEDGVVLPNPLVTNTTASVTVNASATGKLDAWVDFNNNGSFADVGEQVFASVSVVAGNNTLSFAVPNGAIPGNSFARFRLSSTGGLSYNGAAADGEVEDYAVQIVNTQFSINDPSVNEGNAGTSNLSFTVTRTNNASVCSINYAITGGTATTADNDYQVLAAGTLNFTAGGALTAPINVVVNGDVKVELNETVDITLSNPVNGSILKGSGTGTIVNDDAAIITITSPTVTEGDVSTTTVMTYTITMSNPSDANVVVNYNTVDGSATIANNDYQAATGTLTFTPGQTSKTVLVTVNGDCTIEPNENLLLRLSALVNNGRNITLNGGGSTLDGTGTITNDDALPVIVCPGSLLRYVDPGVCTTSMVVPLPTTSSICGTSVLEFHFRTIDKFNNPTGPYSAFAPSGSNTIVVSTGRYEIEWRVTDGSGSSSCSTYLDVQDNQPPQITCPANQNIPANGSCTGTIGSWSALSVSDNCASSGSISVTQTPPSNTVLSGHNASALVTLVAYDGNGNIASCSFTVTLKDVTAPVARCKNATVNLNANGTLNLPPATVDNGSSDNCTFSLTISPAFLTCTDIGMKVVTLTATDAGGNTSTCTARLNIRDVSPPVAICKNPTIFLDNTGHATLTAAQVNDGSSDACGLATMSINQTQFSCSEIGATWPVTLTLTDLNGNSSSCQGQVTVKDAIAPLAVCEDVTVQLGSNGKAAVYGEKLASASSDNCAVWSYSPVAKIYTTANLGVNYLTVTVKDYSMNMSTCVSQVTVIPFNTIINFGGGDESGVESARTSAFDMVVYPNPTTGDAMLAFELPVDQAFTIRVFDVTGRMIYEREANGLEGENTEPMRLSGIAAGVYLVDFQSAGLKAQKRLVVER